MTLRHHRRRDRSVGRLGHGPGGLRAGLAVPAGVPMPLGILSPLAVGGASPACSTASGSPCRPALARRHARRPDRLSRRCPHPGRGPRHRRLPDWFNALGQQPLIGPLTARRSADLRRRPVAVVLLILHGASAASSMSSATTPTRALFGVGVEPVKISLFVASGVVAALAGCFYAARLGLGARRHGDRLRARHHHHRAARRRQHLRRLRDNLGVGLAILVILNLRNGMGLANIEATPRRRNRGDPDRLGPIIRQCDAERDPRSRGPC